MSGVWYDIVVAVLVLDHFHFIRWAKVAAIRLDMRVVEQHFTFHLQSSVAGTFRERKQAARQVAMLSTRM